MPFNEDGSRKEGPLYKKSGFKMKGSPMQRNFGIGSPLHQGLKKEGKQLKKTVIGPKVKPMVDENKNKIPDFVESRESLEGKLDRPTTQDKPKRKPDRPVKPPIMPKSHPVTPPSKIKTKTKTKTKTKVTKGDVLQTLVAPNVNIKKTVKVAKHYGSKAIKKGKSLYSKAKKYLKSDAY